MNERERVERFNQDLDLILHGGTPPEREDAPAEIYKDLDLARRLYEVDSGAANAKETLLQERLLPYAEMKLERQARWRAVLGFLFGLRPALSWATVGILMIIVLNWTFRNVLPVNQPAEIKPVVAGEGVSRAADFVQFRSESYHLNVALPTSWAAAEGKEPLKPGYTGWVAFNSWGQEEFWAGEAGTTPGAVLNQIPDDGAYITLAVQESAAPEINYGSEHKEPELQKFWTESGCQQAGDPAGYSASQFFKWGRQMRVEVFCGSDIPAETASAVKALLESWNFDPIPAGDAGWATASTRLLLPEEAGPEDFPILTDDLSAGSPVARSSRDGSTVRLTQAALQDDGSVAVTHLYHRGAGNANTIISDCPTDSCQRWDFEARPDGSLVLVSQEGAALSVAGIAPQGPENESNAQETQPEETPTPIPPVEPLNSWSHPNEIRERLEESWALWDTVWVDALVTTTYDGEIQITREQIWIEQPDKSLWLSGLPDGKPVDIRITSEGLSAIYDLEKSALREFDHPKLVPSALNKMIFPSWSIALRDGTFEAIKREEIVGRMNLVVDYTNVEGMVSDRFWIDTVTGLILKWDHYSPLPGGRGVAQEIEITAIAYDVEFSEGLFDPEIQPPHTFTFDHVLDRKEP